MYQFVLLEKEFFASILVCAKEFLYLCDIEQTNATKMRCIDHVALGNRLLVVFGFDSCITLFRDTF